MVLGKLDSKCKRMKLDHHLTPCTKINPKRSKDVNVRSETIKFLEENIGSKFLDISLSDVFVYLTLKIWETKARINRRDYNKLKSFYTVKETIIKMKRQHTEWEKTFANHVSEKGLVPKIYKKLIQLNNNNNKTPNNPIKKLGRESEETFCQRRHTDGQQAHEKKFNIIKEIQIKSTVRYRIIPVRMTTIKNTGNNKC